MPHLRLTTPQALALSSLFAVVPLVGGCGGSTSSSKGTPEHDSGTDTNVVIPGRDAGHDAGHDAVSGKDDTGAPDATKPPEDAAADVMHADAESDTGADASVVVPIVVPLSACADLSYTSPVTIGGTQTFQMTIDTGSTTLGVASNNCTNCDVLPYYTPGTTAADTGFTGQEYFGSGMWQGEIYEDAVNIGPSPTAPVDFIAVTSEQYMFGYAGCASASGGMQGLIGFAPAASAVYGTNGFFDNLIAAMGIPNVFATELCDNGGTLWLGGYDPAAITSGATPQYTPLVGSYLSTMFYAVDFVSIVVDGKTFSVSNPQDLGSIVDTGTSLFYIHTAAFARNRLGHRRNGRLQAGLRGRWPGRIGRRRGGRRAGRWQHERVVRDGGLHVGVVPDGLCQPDADPG